MDHRPLLDTGLSVMEFARKATMGFLDGFEGDAFHTAFAPGGGTAAYIVGHIAFTDDMTLRMLAEREGTLSDAEQKLFGGGASPAEQASEYPPGPELIQTMTGLRSSLLGYFREQSEEQLLAPVEGPMAQFGDTRAKLMASLAWHEALHAGQLTVLRRQLGMPRVFG